MGKKHQSSWLKYFPDEKKFFNIFEAKNATSISFKAAIYLPEKQFPNLIFTSKFSSIKENYSIFGW